MIILSTAPMPWILDNQSDGSKHNEDSHLFKKLPYLFSSFLQVPTQEFAHSFRLIIIAMLLGKPFFSHLHYGEVCFPSSQCRHYITGRFLGIIGQNPSVSKSNQLTFVMFRFFVINVRYVM